MLRVRGTYIQSSIRSNLRQNYESIAAHLSDKSHWACGRRWSTSRTSPAWPSRPHVGHLPCGLFKSVATRGATPGCGPLLVRHSLQSPSYGRRLPCLFPCLCLGVSLGRRRLIRLFLGEKWRVPPACFPSWAVAHGRDGWGGLTCLQARSG